MKFRNFTPHQLNIYDMDNNLIIKLPSEGNIRVEEEVSYSGKVFGIPAVTKKYLGVKLPEYDPGKEILIVSKIVLDAIPTMPGLMCPDTGPDSVVRDEDGRIIGVRRLQFRED